MLNYKACVCQQENVPCFSKGCRDALDILPNCWGWGVHFHCRTSPGVEAGPWAAHIRAITGSTPSSPIISENVQNEERPAPNYLK